MRSTAAATAGALHGAESRLRAAGKHVKRVYRVWSPGESGDGCETVLYVDVNDRPRTARWRPVPGTIQRTLEDAAGW